MVVSLFGLAWGVSRLATVATSLGNTSMTRRGLFRTVAALAVGGVAATACSNAQDTDLVSFTWEQNGFRILNFDLNERDGITFKIELDPQRLENVYLLSTTGDKISCTREENQGKTKIQYFNIPTNSAVQLAGKFLKKTDIPRPTRLFEVQIIMENPSGEFTSVGVKSLTM